MLVVPPLMCRDLTVDMKLFTRRRLLASQSNRPNLTLTPLQPVEVLVWRSEMDCFLLALRVQGPNQDQSAIGKIVVM